MPTRFLLLIAALFLLNPNRAAWAAPDASGDAGVGATAPGPDAGVGDRVEDLGHAVSKTASAEGPEAKHLAEAAALAAFFSLIIAGIKNKAWPWHPKWLPLLATGLGLAVAVLTKYAGGAGWVTALVLGGSGPGSVFVHRLVKMLKA